MLIRSLDPRNDRTAVEAFFTASADYIRLERNEEPTPLITEEFFTDAPPGSDPAASARLGLFDADAPGAKLIGIAEMGFGYPQPEDAYLGLMMIDPAARGRGAGVVLLRHLEQVARTRNCPNLYLGVLDCNPRGRAFLGPRGFHGGSGQPHHHAGAEIPDRAPHGETAEPKLIKGG